MFLIGFFTTIKIDRPKIIRLLQIFILKYYIWESNFLKYCCEERYLIFILQLAWHTLHLILYTLTLHLANFFTASDNFIFVISLSKFSALGVKYPSEFSQLQIHDIAYRFKNITFVTFLRILLRLFWVFGLCLPFEVIISNIGIWLWVFCFLSNFLYSRLNSVDCNFSFPLSIRLTHQVYMFNNYFFHLLFFLLFTSIFTSITLFLYADTYHCSYKFNSDEHRYYLVEWAIHF